MLISYSTIQEVKSVPVIELIGQYVQLKRYGDQYRGLCPFHDERTPSFYVHPQKGYICFGCDAKGSNAIKFIMDYKQLAYYDAIAEIATLGSLEIVYPHFTHSKSYIKKPSVPLIQSEIDFIPSSTYQKQLINGIALYSQNNFIKWLGNEQRGNHRFDKKTIEDLIETYFLGNSDQEKYKGWILFPYIDIMGRVCDIKAMDYDSVLGQRIRRPENRCKFIGKEILNAWDANTVRCFYGEHRLQGNNKPVKLFESEATASYSAPFFPGSICLATGGKNGCKWIDKDVCKVLIGRHVTLYPDIDAHDEWMEKAKILRGYGINVKVSQLVKENALRYAEETGINYIELVNQKYDLRDILKHKNLLDFLSPIPKHLPISEDNIVVLLETHTGKDFDNMILAYIETESGMQLDLLFDKNGNAITLQTGKVDSLAEFYDKKFTEIIMGGERFFGNMIKENKNFSSSVPEIEIRNLTLPHK